MDGWRHEDADTTFVEKAIGFLEDHKKDNAGEDSYNVLPVLLGTTIKHIRKALVQHSCWGAFTIRKGKWKLILGTKGSGGWINPRDKDPDESTPGQLYDIFEDPYENRDLWDTHPEVVAELKALLDRYK